MGGSASGSDSSSDSSGSGSSGYQNSANSGANSNFGQDVWGVLEQYAPGVFQGAQDLWSNSQGQFNKYSNAGDAAAWQSGQIANQAMQPWQQQSLGGASSGMANETYENLANSLNSSLAGGQSQSGKLYEDIIGGPGNTYADPLADQMALDSQINMERNIMPTIRDQASTMGQSGSSRHGVAEGIAAGDSARNLNAAQTAMREKNYETDMDWKMQIANQADQMLGDSQDRAMDLINNVDKSQQYGLNQSSNMQGLSRDAMEPIADAIGMPFDQFAKMAASLGIADPAVLSSGSSSSSSSSQGDGFSDWMSSGSSDAKGRSVSGGVGGK